MVLENLHTFQLKLFTDYKFIPLKLFCAKLLQKSEMRKDIVIELSYKGFG